MIKEFWSSITQKVATFKSVISGNGMTVARNYETRDLRQGDLGLTIRVDKSKVAEMSAEQRSVAKITARNMFSELMKFLGVTETDEQLAFRPNGVVKATHVDASEKVIYGVFVSMNQAFYILKTLNESGLAVTTTLPVSKYLLDSVLDYSGIDGLIAYQGCCIDVFHPLRNLKNEEYLAKVGIFSPFRQNAIYAIQQIKDQKILKMIYNASRKGTQSFYMENDTEENIVRNVEALANMDDSQFITDELLGIPPSFYTKFRCLSSLSDKQLAKIVKSVQNYHLHEQALERISDVSLIVPMLPSIGQRFKRGDGEEIANLFGRVFGKATDLALRFEIASKWDGRSLHPGDAEKMLDQFSTSQLIDIACSAPNYMFRRAATRAIRGMKDHRSRDEMLYRIIKAPINTALMSSDEIENLPYKKFGGRYYDIAEEANMATNDFLMVIIRDDTFSLDQRYRSLMGLDLSERKRKAVLDELGPNNELVIEYLRRQ